MTLLMKLKHVTSLQPDELGFYGNFGGAYVPELLEPNIRDLREACDRWLSNPSFQEDFLGLMKDYVGRPSPLSYSSKLSEKYGASIYLKREDLNHTGSHKINNAIGQILTAKRMGKTRIIAETGAGQHGVATATACALMGMECVVYMGAVDVARQAPNVQRMKFLGTEVVAVESGSKTLKDATNEAIRQWINDPEVYYLIGSVVGPDPYPSMVAYFQSIISFEMRSQLLEQTGKELPTKVIACVGGGSNAAGAFYHYYDEPEVELIAVEAAGLGVNSGKSAATSVLGTPGILHGSRTFLMQTEDGQVVEPHSISAGLDYPGIGPLHAHSIDTGRTQVVTVEDEEALEAGHELSRLDGIIPALESAHAVAALKKITSTPDDVIVINLSGRGDKDMSTYENRLL